MGRGILWAGVFSLAVAVTAGCARERAEPAKVVSSAPPAHAEWRLESTPASTAPVRAAPPKPAEIGDVRNFSGFSSDEKQFAFSVFSEAAGFHLLHVVNAQGQIVLRFQLPDDRKVEEARTFLQKEGFTPASGELPGDLGKRLSVTVRDGKAVVSAGRRVLYDANPFEQGTAASASLGKVAPSGRRVAVKVEQVPVTEFGGITTYVIVDLTPAIEEAG